MVLHFLSFFKNQIPFEILNKFFSGFFIFSPKCLIYFPYIFYKFFSVLPKTLVKLFSKLCVLTCNFLFNFLLIFSRIFKWISYSFPSNVTIIFFSQISVSFQFHLNFYKITFNIFLVLFFQFSLKIFRRFRQVSFKIRNFCETFIKMFLQFFFNFPCFYFRLL